MKLIVENRAAVLLYKFLVSNKIEGFFLLPSNVCPIVPSVFRLAEVDYQFVDINLINFSMDLDEVKYLIKKNSNVAGVLYVNSYGEELNISNEFKELKRLKDELILIHDKCLCIPEFEINEKSPFVDLVLYSTGYSKFVELGYGGYGFVNIERVDYHDFELEYCKEDVEKLDINIRTSLKNHTECIIPRSNWLGNSRMVGNINSYLHEINIKIDDVRKHKMKINDIYLSDFDNKMILKGSSGVWRFNIWVKNKEQVLNALFSNDLFASSHYQPLSGIFGEGTSDNANYLFDHVINLFNDYRYNEEKALKTVQIVKDIAII